MGTGKSNRNSLSRFLAGGTGKRLLLYRLTTIIKALYPTGQTHNPYPIEQSNLCQELDREEQLLFSDLLHSLTLINNLSRLPSGQRLISTRADFLNSLQLILPKQSRLTQKGMEAHGKLSGSLGNSTFDYVKAARTLKVSVKTVTRLFKPLIAHGLVQQLSTKRYKRALFQISETEQQDTSRQLFETMQGEWKDFIGFVEM